MMKTLLRQILVFCWNSINSLQLNVVWMHMFVFAYTSMVNTMIYRYSLIHDPHTQWMYSYIRLLDAMQNDYLTLFHNFPISSYILLPNKMCVIAFSSKYKIWKWVIASWSAGYLPRRMYSQKYLTVIKIDMHEALVKYEWLRYAFQLHIDSCPWQRPLVLSIFIVSLLLLPPQAMSRFCLAWII